MREKVLNVTYDLVDEIKGSGEYKRLLELKDIIDGDQEITLLVSAFNKAKVKYGEVMKYGKYHPDLKKVQLLLKDTKESLYENGIIKEYKELEKQLQKKLDHISSSLAKSVSSRIKHPNELGLINKH
jgi:cell fate (sporulation/competence/biofilm development) regulator YlbF (YheA/YmcA/DUF963 family)